MVGVVKVVGVVRLLENTQREKRGLVHAGRKREVVGRTCATAASSSGGGGGSSRWGW